MELASMEFHCQSMFDILLWYLDSYGLLFGFGMATREENIIQASDISFHVVEDLMYRVLESCRGVGHVEWQPCVF